MERILEPEFMDTPSEANDYDAMDHTVANLDVVARFVAIGGGVGRVLDLGTGPGDIPILLVRHCPELHVLGVDAAATMLEIAQRKTATAELSQQITFQQTDVKELPFAEASFDGVFSNTILHHIPEPIDLLREAYRVLKPGGTLLIRDLYRPTSIAEAWGIVDRHATGAAESQRKLFFDSLHAALTLEEARQLVGAVGMPGATVEMSSDRHYTIECRRTK